MKYFTLFLCTNCSDSNVGFTCTACLSSDSPRGKCSVAASAVLDGARLPHQRETGDLPLLGKGEKTSQCLSTVGSLISQSSVSCVFVYSSLGEVLTCKSKRAEVEGVVWPLSPELVALGWQPASCVFHGWQIFPNLSSLKNACSREPPSVCDPSHHVPLSETRIAEGRNKLGDLDVS